MRDSVFGGTPGHLNSEKFLLAVANSFLKEGDVVVDAGANHGQHSRIFGNCVGLQGQVHCIEADPQLSRQLSKAAAQSDYRIFVHNLALNDGQVEKVNFFSHKTRDQEGSIFLREDISSYTENSVDAASLDSLNVSNVKLIKIDVEGAEFDVLRGAQQTIQMNKPLISVELTRFGGNNVNYSPTDFLKLVDILGCNLYNLTGEKVGLLDWMNKDFFMNHMNWIVVKESAAESFIHKSLKNLAMSFCWGATDLVPYPFKLIDHPIP